MNIDSMPRPSQDNSRSLTDRRRRLDRAFHIVCVLAASAAVCVLLVVLVSIFTQGIPRLSWKFLTSPPHPSPALAGLKPALFGSIWVCTVCALITLPIGVGTAVLLEEFKPRALWLRRLHRIVQLNISNLAGVPSVVYGILGVTAFATMFGLAGSSQSPAFEIGARHFEQFVTEGDTVVLIPVSRGSVGVALQDGMSGFVGDDLVTLTVIGATDPLPKDKNLRRTTLRSDAEGGRITRRTWYYFSIPLGRGVLTGAMTLMLVVLPVMIITTEEALRAVPNSLREAALGLGATRWQMVWGVTLPASLPGILTGAILAMSRAIGEAAPILIIAGVVYVSAAPASLMDEFTVMPLQIFNWAQRPQHEFVTLAAAGIVVLLAVLLTCNLAAILLRHRLQIARN